MKTTFVTQKSGHCCGDRCAKRPTPWRADTPDKARSPREEIEQMTRKVEALTGTLDRAAEAEIAAALARHADVAVIRNDKTGATAAFLMPVPYWQQDKKA